ncbi:MAG: (4Fe-4S)-binding protein [Acidobacteria bacterium 13_1_20CM_58_21]|nr:MAG: (4Fe-4S)-binding protein [Acidobacteria bacterium 13_1_20CM_58_21]
MSASEKTYTNGEITVIWKPGVCIHSGKCVQGLGPVFNINARPWINMQGCESNSIVKQVEQCPSGALSYEKTSQASG